jgi:hypothetical protein
MMFQVFNQSLFKSSHDLFFFEFDMNMGTSPIVCVCVSGLRLQNGYCNA